MSSPIGGFMPIPLAMMMPFMAAQSMLMGDAFGKGFQFGKRKISAMSNEQFNSLTMSSMVTDMQTEFKNIVPTIKQSIIDSRQVQNVIISEMIKIVPEFLKFMTGQAITTAVSGVDELAHLIGAHAGHDTTITSPTTTLTTTSTEPTTTTTTTDTRTKIEIANPSYTITTVMTGTETRTLSSWLELLKISRTRAEYYITRNPTLSEKYTKTVFQISQFLKLATGKWY